MKRFTAGTVLAIAALWTMTGHAEDAGLSAHVLLHSCQHLLAPEQPHDTFGWGFEVGLCGGIIIASRHFADKLPIGSRACIPDGVSAGELARVVISYVEGRPERMHQPMQVLAIEAMRDAWPCEK